MKKSYQTRIFSGHYWTLSSQF